MSSNRARSPDGPVSKGVFRCKMRQAEAVEGAEQVFSELGLEEYGVYNDEDQKHGFCLVVNQAQSRVHLGTYLHDLADGLGISKSGTETYSGHFKKGKRHGIGRISSPAAIFDGSFKENKLTGPGRLIVQAQGETRVGYFSKKGLDGFGELLTANYHYVGFFHEGKAEGYGEETCESGEEMYYGYFENGQRHGLGVMIRRSNNLNGPGEGELKMEYSGEWFEGQRTGWGFLKKSNRLEYFGQFLRGIQMGIGETIFSDGAKFLGEYSYGKKAGFGKSVSQDQQTYIGEWLSDQKHGTGFGNDPSSDWCYLGPWVMGKPGPIAENVLADEQSETATEFFAESRQSLFAISEEIYQEKQKLKGQISMLKLDISREKDRLSKDLEEILNTTDKIPEIVSKKASVLLTLAWRNGIELPMQHFETLNINLPQSNQDGTFGGIAEKRNPSSTAGPRELPSRSGVQGVISADSPVKQETSSENSPGSSQRKLVNKYRITLDPTDEVDNDADPSPKQIVPSNREVPDLNIPEQMKLKEAGMAHEMSRPPREDRVLGDLPSPAPLKHGWNGRDPSDSGEQITSPPSHVSIGMPETSQEGFEIKQTSGDLATNDKTGLEMLLDPTMISAIESKFLFSDQRNQISDLTNRLRLETLKKDKVVKKAAPEHKPRLDAAAQTELKKSKETMDRIEARKKQIEDEIGLLDSRLKTDFGVCYTNRTQSSS